ncbi:unnamed protein product [Closterium sp. Yama58-4]|nr:unnamed protein product [Closterium sp. Yama58-4]
MDQSDHTHMLLLSESHARSTDPSHTLSPSPARSPPIPSHHGASPVSLRPSSPPRTAPNLASLTVLSVLSSPLHPLLSLHAWLRGLVASFGLPFVALVGVVYGVSEGYAGALYHFASQYYWMDVQRLQPASAQAYMVWCLSPKHLPLPSLPPSSPVDSAPKPPSPSILPLSPTVPSRPLLLHPTRQWWRCLGISAPFTDSSLTPSPSAVGMAEPSSLSLLPSRLALFSLPLSLTHLPASSTIFPFPSPPSLSPSLSPSNTYRQRPYLFLSALLGLLCSLLVALLPALPPTLASLLLAGTTLSTAFADVLVDGLVAAKIRTKPQHAGDLQALPWGILALSSLLAFALSGPIVSAFGARGAFFFYALAPFALLVTVLLVPEAPVAARKMRESGWGSLKRSVRLFVRTLRNRVMWRAAIFLFMSHGGISLDIPTALIYWYTKAEEGPRFSKDFMGVVFAMGRVGLLIGGGISPDIPTALIYWYTKAEGGPRFSKDFMGVVFAMGRVGLLIGVFIYHRCFKSASYRSLLLFTLLLLFVTGFLDLVIITRVNITLGIPDHFFVLGDTAISDAVRRLELMPILVLAARLCPPGIEATLFAFCMSLMVFGEHCAAWQGALMLHLLGVRKDSYERLWLAVVLRNLFRLLPIAFLWLLPEGGPDTDLLGDMGVDMDGLEEESEQELMVVHGMGEDKEGKTGDGVNYRIISVVPLKIIPMDDRRERTRAALISSHFLAALLLAAAVGGALPPAEAVPPGMPRKPAHIVRVLLRQNRFGARCLDGSPPGFYIRRGYGTGRKSFIIYLQGGGWCHNVAQCAERTQTVLGSSKFWRHPTDPAFQASLQKYGSTFTGILSRNATENPSYYNWHVVNVFYCDGGGFSGTAGAVRVNSTFSMHLDGAKILQAVLEDLQLRWGMRTAKRVLFTGCSAGGQAVSNACDIVADQLPWANVKCLMDGGFFLDGSDVTGQMYFRTLAKRMTELHHSIMDPDCKNANPRGPWRCFFPQFNLFYISRPLFIVNSVADYAAIEIANRGQNQSSTASIFSCLDKVLKDETVLSTASYKLTMARTILFAVDSSEDSYNAVRWAAEHLLRQGDRIVILHAQSQPDLVQGMVAKDVPLDPETVESIRTHISNLSRRTLQKCQEICAAHKFSAETRVEIGDARMVICEQAEQLSADLLVVGSRGLGLLTRQLLGSVSSYCVHNAPVPVLVVRPEGEGSK